ncbi:MAG: hypothetical protein ACYTF1_25305 [Planctomycetota bacterium]|jgi:hypothetical protein
MIAIPFFMTFSMVFASPDSPINLNQTKQLFLDDYMIASKANVERRIHPVNKHPANPLIWPSESWEGKVALLYGSVIQDGNKYRMWYHSGPGVSYAESRDGITWTKPQLNIFEINGHKTNVVIRKKAIAGQANMLGYYYEHFGVNKDPNEPDPLRRYKMGFLSIHRDYNGPREDIFHKGQRRGLGVAVSPDGFHWKMIDNWVTEAICDGPTHWMFDPARKKYVLYGRTKYIDPEVKQQCSEDQWCKRYFWGRSVTRLASSDLIKWNITERGAGPVVLTPDTQDPVGDEIYSMMVFPYESVYIGLVQVFHNQPETCNLDVQLAVSHDSVNFTRVGDRLPFIPNGSIGSWDRFNNSMANNPPIAVGDELRFYYSGRTYRHSPYSGKDKGISGGGIGMATIKRDRFVSLGASFDGGRINTKPLKLEGKRLHLNAKSDHGEILIKVVTQDGTTIAQSRPLKCDSLDAVIEWEEGNLDRIDGPVTLQITLKNALLFAIWCS